METGDQTEGILRCLRERNGGDVSCGKACEGEQLQGDISAG